LFRQLVLTVTEDDVDLRSGCFVDTHRQVSARMSDTNPPWASAAGLAAVETLCNWHASH
jgi:hypothetical protein